jgi:hypothetical protein
MRVIDAVARNGYNDQVMSRRVLDCVHDLRFVLSFAAIIKSCSAFMCRLIAL